MRCVKCISSGVQQVAEETEKSALSSEEIAQSTQILLDGALSLGNSVEKFKSL